MSNRLAHLIARTARESATARRLVFELLVQQLTTDEARRLTRPPGPAPWTRYGSRLKAWARSSGPRAGARSIIHRPSDNAPREHRVGFDAEYDRMEKDEVYDASRLWRRYQWKRTTIPSVRREEPATAGTPCTPEPLADENDFPSAEANN